MGKENLVEIDNKTILKIIRRVSIQKLDKIFRESIKTVSERYIENKDKFYDMKFTKFKMLTVNNFLVELCINYPDVCASGGEFYNDAFDFFKNHYLNRMKEEWGELQNINESTLIQESNIPTAIRRRLTNSDIEEVFLKSLDLIDYERARNQFSPIKNISLHTFAKLVIDEMITSFEQDYFSDDNRIYFDDDEKYHNEIRVPLMNYFGDRIKERYSNSDTKDINESILMEEARTASKIRRRIEQIHYEVKRLINSVYTPKVICKRYTGGNELTTVISHAVIENLYFNTFYDIDDESKEWEEIAQFIFDYIHENLGDIINSYYQSSCE